MKKNYTIEFQPSASGTGFTATIVELDKTVTGATQFDALIAAHQVIFEVQGAALAEAQARRLERQQQRARTVA
jgi:hypothetical protein